MHSWKLSFRLLGVLPLLTAALLLTFYLIAAFHAGHLPGYDDPDPKQVPAYSVFQPLITVALFLGFVSAIAWMIMAAAYLVCYWLRKDKLPTGSFLFSILAQLFTFICALFIGTWFLD